MFFCCSSCAGRLALTDWTDSSSLAVLNSGGAQLATSEAVERVAWKKMRGGRNITCDLAVLLYCI